MDGKLIHHDLELWIESTVVLSDGANKRAKLQNSFREEMRNLRGKTPFLLVKDSPLDLEYLHFYTIVRIVLIYLEVIL